MAKIILVLQDYKNTVAVDAYYATQQDCDNPTNACTVANAICLMIQSGTAPKVHIGPASVVAK